MTCPVCGAEFERSRPRQRFCSRTCKQRASSRAAAARKKAARHSARKPIACAICGKEFVPSTKLACYCSRTCRSRAFRMAHAVHHEERACKWCGKRFTPRRGDNVFCSPRCAANARYRASARARSSEVVDEARVRAYLALPAAERWARRGELTPAEHKFAEKIWNDSHVRTTVLNDLMR